MEIDRYIVKPYTMNGGGLFYIGKEKVPTICAMYCKVFSHFPEKPYLMEIKRTVVTPYLSHGSGLMVPDIDGKTPCFPASYHKGVGGIPARPFLMESSEDICVAMRGREVIPGEKIMQQLEPRKDGKTNCITTVQKDNMVTNSSFCRIRKLTPLECSRLQTIPAWYVWKGRFKDGKIKETSNTQKYKMIGNAWCVEVIKHIFSFIPKNQDNEICS